MKGYEFRWEWGPIAANSETTYVIARGPFAARQLFEQHVKSLGLWHKVGWQNVRRRNIDFIPPGEVIF